MASGKEVKIGDDSYTIYSNGSFNVENQERKLRVQTSFNDMAFRTAIVYECKKEHKRVELELLSQNGSYVKCEFFPEEKKEELLKLLFEQAKFIKESPIVTSDSFIMAAFKHLRHQLKKEEEKTKPKYFQLDNVILSEGGCSIELPAKTILVGPRYTFLDALGDKEEARYKNITCYDSNGKNILHIPINYILEKDGFLELVKTRLGNLSKSKQFRVRAKNGKLKSRLVEIMESPDEYVMRINQKK